MDDRALILALSIAPFIIWGLLANIALRMPDDEAPEQTQS